jgi:hypothetical protein
VGLMGRNLFMQTEDTENFWFWWYCSIIRYWGPEADSNPHGCTRREMAALSRFQVYGLEITPKSGPKCVLSVVELKPGATPISPKQYFIHSKAPVRIQKHFADS